MQKHRWMRLLWDLGFTKLDGHGSLPLVGAPQNRDAQHLEKMIERKKTKQVRVGEVLVGGGALAAGMMKWGGKFSETLSAIGTGVLSGYAYRMAEEKARAAT